MKSKVVLTAIGLCIAFGVALADTPGETTWFDLQNCAMCKNMTAQAGLMEHMNWENHVIGAGMMMLTIVDPDYEAAYATAMKGMQATGQELMAGKEMPLCGSCVAMGKLIMAGAKMENLDTKGGHVMLLTSTDPELVKEIQAYGQRNIDEMAKMVGESNDAPVHEGHGH